MLIAENAVTAPAAAAANAINVIMVCTSLVYVVFRISCGVLLFVMHIHTQEETKMLHKFTWNPGGSSLYNAAYLVSI